jgi:hypothetical protein
MAYVSQSFRHGPSAVDGRSLAISIRLKSLGLAHHAARQTHRFGSEADISLGGSQASQKRARICFGSHLVATYVSSVSAGTISSSSE